MSDNRNQQGQKGQTDQQGKQNPQGAGERDKKNPTQQPKGREEFKDPKTPTPNRDHK